MERDKETGIMYRRWARSAPESVLILVHGLGAHSARWTFLTDFFLQNDISSYAIELKGFGETKEPRGHIDSFRIYYDDILRLYDIASGENPGKKIFLAGESLGALISFEVTLLKPGLFDGLICISPAFASAMKFAFPDYLSMILSLFYNQKKQFEMPFDSAMCTRDRDYQGQMDSDPRECRFATARLLFETAKAQVHAMLSTKRLEADVMFLLAGDDKLVDTNIAEKVFKKLNVKNKTITRYPGMYHALSIDSGREKVFEDILEWIRERR